jgi:hypothetical protein
MPGRRVLLLSTYELGHQPLGLATAAAALRAAGHEVRCLDLAVEPAGAAVFAWPEVVGVSVPMHTAARLGIAVARTARSVNPGARIVFYGLYAAPLAEVLAEAGLADAAIAGEFEEGLAELAGSSCEEPSPDPFLAAARFGRSGPPLPDRSGLPPLDRYARLRIGDELRLAGYVEASRGCAHRCRHCPITPVYAGRLRLVPREVVLADVDQLVALGAQHITFGDPDFLNAVPHSLAIVEEMARRHPGLTFDATIKVEHLLEHAPLLTRLRDLGCLFITSAFESTNDRTLALLEKGHTRADMARALGAARHEGVVIRPTWVAFTPWTARRDYLDLLDFVEEHDLVGHVQPVQYALRLLVPPGSALIPTLAGQELLGPFDSEGLTYRWANPDSGLEALQAAVAAIVEDAASGCQDEPAKAPEVTFARVRQAADDLLLGERNPLRVPRAPAKPVPGLTESWFC